MTSLAKRREAVEQVQQVFEVSERRVCRAMQQARSTQRYQRVERDNEAQLTQEIVALAGRYGRYGYRRITGPLHDAGWQVKPQTGGAYLVTRRAESARKAAETGTIVVECWLLCAHPIDRRG